MNYKNTLFFIAKSLTISHEQTTKIWVEEQLKKQTIDWDEVVKISTAHYVFPALYCNLKRADFLHYLPEELVNYMQHIYQLNRNRNQQIINQATALNSLLNEHEIQAVFLKGTGNLIEELYDDIAERMVGDIDFIFSERDYQKAIKIIHKNGYNYVSKDGYHFPTFKHYPRLVKNGELAAVEIHKEILKEKYAVDFNFTTIKDDTQIINNFKVLSFDHQLALSICAKQLNDDGVLFNDISLRNAYDVFLLSKKTNAKNAIPKSKILFHPLNNFLASCHVVFDGIKSLNYTKTDESILYLKTFNRYYDDDNFRKKKFKKISKNNFIVKRLKIILKIFTDKNYRHWLYNRVTDKNWQKEKRKQLKG